MDANQEQILIQAEKLFLRFGYVKTTVAEIARAAGLAKGSLYRHFKSKEDIFIEILARRVEEVVGEMDKLMAQPGPPAKRVRRVFTTFLEKALQQRESFFPGMQVPSPALVREIFKLYRNIRPQLGAMLSGALNLGRQEQGRGGGDEVVWLLNETLINVMTRMGPDVEFDYRRYAAVLAETVIGSAPEARQT